MAGSYVYSGRNGTMQLYEVIVEQGTILKCFAALLIAIDYSGRFRYK